MSRFSDIGYELEQKLSHRYLFPLEDGGRNVHLVLFLQLLVENMKLL